MVYHGGRWVLRLAAVAVVLVSAAEDDTQLTCPAGDSSCKPLGPSSTLRRAGGEAFRPSLSPDQPKVRVYTVEELREYDGTYPDRPLLLACLGEVYDVSAGSKHYGKGRDYAGLAGRDGSRAFSTGDFENKSIASDILDLDDEGINEILGWRTFYREHKQYTFQGYLVERYFDENGVPTAEYGKLEAIHEASNQAGKIKQELQKRFPSCNSRHEAVNSYFEVWCDDGYHGRGTKPMHFRYKLPASKTRKADEGHWCACVNKKKRKVLESEMEEQSKKPSIGAPTLRLVEYPECNMKKHCKRPKGAKPPE